MRYKRLKRELEELTKEQIMLRNEFDDLYEIMKTLRDQFRKELSKCVDLNQRTHNTILSLKHGNNGIQKKTTV